MEREGVQRTSVGNGQVSRWVLPMAHIQHTAVAYQSCQADHAESEKMPRVVEGQEYEFDLLLAACDIDSPALANALYEAGCDDALVGRNGEGPMIAFNRIAHSRSDAIRSAIADAESVPGVRVVGVA